jgi:hypothetical protein
MHGHSHVALDGVSGRLAASLSRLATEAAPGDVELVAAALLTLTLASALYGLHGEPEVSLIKGVRRVAPTEPSPSMVCLIATAATQRSRHRAAPDFVAAGAACATAALVAEADQDAAASELFRSFALACEAHLRIGRALSSSHRERGWNPSCTVGVLTAAIASCLVSGASDDVLRHALGIAGAQVLGRSSDLGTVFGSYSVGKAAENGYLAFLLARAGFTGPVNLFDARRGYLHLLSDEPETTHLTDSWGERWYLADVDLPADVDGAVRQLVPDRELRELLTGSPVRALYDAIAGGSFE